MNSWDIAYPQLTHILIIVSCKCFLFFFNLFIIITYSYYIFIYKRIFYRDISTSNLVYLSSDQALADLAEFIVNIKIKYNIPSTAKWIAFGGSYPGTLAAWLRMKYPHLIHAAVSSSGPLLAKIDFKGMSIKN